jgi:hypothetical protein
MADGKWQMGNGKDEHFSPLPFAITIRLHFFSGLA